MLIIQICQLLLKFIESPSGFIKGDFMRFGYLRYNKQPSAFSIHFFFVTEKV